MRSMIRRTLQCETFDPHILKSDEITAKAKLMRGRLPPVAGGRRDSSEDDPRLHNAYVVLRPMRIPAGLHGAHSAVFFIPKGTERPRGDPGHSTLYDFNDMSCRGTDPGCSR